MTRSAICSRPRWRGPRDGRASCGCEGELDGLHELVARGGGAGAQRAVYEIAGIDAVVRRLVELTQGGR